MSDHEIRGNGTTSSGIRAGAIAAVGLGLLALLVSAVPSGQAATVLPVDPPACYGSQTWTLAGSPYQIPPFAAPTFCEGATLTIEPGVVVQLAGGQALSFAILQAVGTPEAPIVFTAYEPSGEEGLLATVEAAGHGYWGGLQPAGTSSTARLEHVVVEHAGFDGCIFGASRRVAWPPECASPATPAIAVGASGALTAARCEVRHNAGWGLRASTSGAVLVERCDVHHNAGGGVFVRSDTRGWSVRDNRVHDNGGRGVHTESAVPGSVARNHLARNDVPLRMSAATEPLDNAFEDNAIHEIEVADIGEVASDVVWQRNLDASGALVRYHANSFGGSFKVSSAGRLTIEPGNTVAFGPGGMLFSRGTVEASGTRADPILFTPDATPGQGGVLDDAIAAWRGYWMGIHSSQGALALANVTIEHAGFDGCIAGLSQSVDVLGGPCAPPASAIEVEAGALTIVDCIVRHNGGLGIRAMGASARVERCDVEHNRRGGILAAPATGWVLRGNDAKDNGGYGIEIRGERTGRVERNTLERNDVPLRIVGAAEPLDNAFRDNRLDEIHVSHEYARAVSEVVWQRNLDAASGDLVVYHLLGSFDVNPGRLTIEAGNVLAFAPRAQLTVQGEGTLHAAGTAEDRILLTSDAAVKAPGDWNRLAFGVGTGSRQVLENVTVEYAGAFNSPQVQSEGAPAVPFGSCIVRYGLGHGTDGPLSLRGCEVHHNGGNGVAGVVTLRDTRVHDNSGIGVWAQGWDSDLDGNAIDRNGLALRMQTNTRIGPGNTFEGNAVSEIQVSDGHVRDPRTWPRFADAATAAVLPYHALGSLLVVDWLTIEPGNVVTLAPGADFVATGLLVARGTVESPIVITSDASAKAPGQWGYLGLGGSGDGPAHVLENATLEYGGGSTWRTTALAGSRVSVVKNCVVRHNANSGIEVESHGSPSRRFVIEGCLFHDNAIGVDLTGFGLALRGNRFVDNGIGVKHQTCCGRGIDLVADNNLFDNPVNALVQHPWHTAWFVEKTQATERNIIGGPFFGGNAWSDYEGVDCTGDGLGDTLLPYATQGSFGGGADYHPLVPVHEDTVPPASEHALDGTAGKNGWWRSAVRVTLEGTDDWCGVHRLLYRVDEGPELAYEGAFDVTGDGIHVVRYHAVDAAGNVEAERAVDIAIDATPPTALLVDPVRGNVYVDDFGVPLALRGPCAASPAADACARLDLLAEDCEDVMPAESCDAQPFDGVLHLTVLVGAKTLAADADDATSGVATVEFVVDGRSLATDADAPYTSAWDTTRETLGRHLVWVVAEDAAGNRGESPVEDPIVVPLDAALLAQGLADAAGDVDAAAWCRGLDTLVPKLGPVCDALPARPTAPGLPARAPIALPPTPGRSGRP